MFNGPGKYDEVCTVARELSGALGVVLIVKGGTQGDGFSVQAPLDLILGLPHALRDVANKIEAEIQREQEALQWNT